MAQRSYSIFSEQGDNWSLIAGRRNVYSNENALNAPLSIAANATQIRSPSLAAGDSTKNEEETRKRSLSQSDIDGEDVKGAHCKPRLASKANMNAMEGMSLPPLVETPITVEQNAMVGPSVPPHDALINAATRQDLEPAFNELLNTFSPLIFEAVQQRLAIMAEQYSEQLHLAMAAFLVSLSNSPSMRASPIVSGSASSPVPAPKLTIAKLAETAPYVPKFSDGSHHKVNDHMEDVSNLNNHAAANHNAAHGGTTFFDKSEDYAESHSEHNVQDEVTSNSAPNTPAPPAAAHDSIIDDNDNDEEEDDDIESDDDRDVEEEDRNNATANIPDHLEGAGDNYSYSDDTESEDEAEENKLNNATPTPTP